MSTQQQKWGESLVVVFLPLFFPPLSPLFALVVLSCSGLPVGLVLRNCWSKRLSFALPSTNLFAYSTVCGFPFLCCLLSAV